jgi:hypothetical protein
MRQQQKQWNEKETNLLQTLQELRHTLQAANQQAAWKEDQLTNEIQV